LWNKLRAVDDGKLGVVDDGEKRREWWTTGRGLAF
jgi:hypothetical protein